MWKEFRDWSGVAFAGKFGLPILLLLGSWLVAFPVRDAVTAMLFLAIIVPMVSSAVFLLLVPGQLKSEERVIMFRRWLRWQVLPTEDIDTIQRAISVFGYVRLGGASGRLIFFVEPENRHLLGFEGHSDLFETRGNVSATCVEESYGITQAISAAAGFATGILWFWLSPRSASEQTLPRLFVPVFEFEGRHPQVLTAFALLLVLTWLVRGERKTRSQSILAFCFLGIMVSRFFVLK